MDNSVKKLINSIPNLEFAYLFGSRAKGTAKKDSDYDICIVIKDNDKDTVVKLVTEYLFQSKIFIHPLILTKEEFEVKTKIDIYKKEIIDNGILIDRE